MENVWFSVILAIVMIMFLFDLWLGIINYRYRNHPIPENVADVYDDETYQNWLAYKMENHRYGIIVQSLRLVLFLSLLLFGFFPFLAQSVESWTESLILQTLFFIGIYVAITQIISMPAAYYHQLSIEERFGFNKATKKTFWTDQIKSLFLTIVMGGGVLALLVVIFQQIEAYFYPVALIATFLILLAIQVLFVKLFLPLFNKLTPLEDSELKDGIEALATKAGYEVSKIRVMDASRRSTKLNAFFSGMGRFKQVVLFDTLIDKMSNEQILSVLAHEIGHAKHKDIIRNIILSFFNIALLLLVVWLCITHDPISQAFGFDEAHFGFGLILFTVLISPVSTLLGIGISYLSRKAEYKADAYAKSLGYQEAMIGALKVLSRENYANLTPHPILVTLTYSHPPTSARIEALNR